MDEKKKRQFHIRTVLNQVLRQNPEIIVHNIELFSEISYPIAILELTMKETSFEEFDFIQLTILRFIALGIIKSKDIAAMTGLHENYVRKIKVLLMGLDYIDKNGMRPLGEESLQCEKVIKRTTVKQRFQADALTGDLLQVGELFEDSEFRERNRTSFYTPHLPHIEGITTDYVNKQLSGVDLTKYKQYRGSILNANADVIEDAKCIGMAYIKAYMLKLKGIEHPFIITNHVNTRKKAFNERYRWQPIRIPSDSAYSLYGFSQDIPCYSDESSQVIDDLYRLMCQNIAKMNDNKLKKALEREVALNEDFIDIDYGKIRKGSPDQIFIYLNEKSFLKWNFFILNFLEDYDPNQGYLYIKEGLDGLFIRFVSQSNILKKAAARYKKALKQYDKAQLNAFIKSRLFDNDSECIDFKEFIDILDEYESFGEEYEKTEESS